MQFSVSPSACDPSPCGRQGQLPGGDPGYRDPERGRGTASRAAAGCYPGPAAAGLVRAGPAVVGSERRQLLAAFNGGFKIAAGAGGYMQEGHVIGPLHPGFASLVIDRSGRARIGVWGYGTPSPGEAVYSVRQNLRPLVLDGKSTTAAYDWRRSTSSPAATPDLQRFRA